MQCESHAKTCMAGPYFLEFTGKQCDVTDVAIVTATLAFNDKLTGETTLLHFNQILLWYRMYMKMSRINPHQFLHFRIAVSMIQQMVQDHLGCPVKIYLYRFRWRVYKRILSVGAHSLQKLRIVRVFEPI
jgi:hypothetical protein